MAYWAALNEAYNVDFVDFIETTGLADLVFHDWPGLDDFEDGNKYSEGTPRAFGEGGARDWFKQIAPVRKHTRIMNTHETFRSSYKGP